MPHIVRTTGQNKTDQRYKYSVTVGRKHYMLHASHRTDMIILIIVWIVLIVPYLKHLRPLSYKELLWIQISGNAAILG